MISAVDQEIQQIRDLLPTSLFEDSKDWRGGSTVERIEWLLVMYESSKHERNALEMALYDIPHQYK
jgi:ATP-dependent protease HslVU (ClpYQ) peptidase subunit